jgi:hypothetical protein
MLRADGVAEIVDETGLAIRDEAFMEKYRDGLRRIGETAQQFSQGYNRKIIVRPEVWQVW